jgi:DNA-binding transcriptional LysR family regulator
MNYTDNMATLIAKKETMNQLDLIQALIAVADTGSVQKAAGQLNQTTSAISRKITKLESSLGVQLLKRHRTGTVLTEIGQRYYYECKAALLQFKKAEQLAVASLDHPAGKLRVVASLFYAKTWLIPKLASFIERYPDIELHLDIQEIQPNFEKNKMDILFGGHMPGSDDLVRKRIAKFRRILCASPEYLKEYGCPKGPAELLQHKFITHEARLQQNVVLLDDDEPVLIKPYLFINQTQIIIDAALANLGIIWLNDKFVGSLLADGDTKIAAFVEHFTKT